MIDLPLPLMLAALFALGFVQNMAFTWVSRSRNGGDVAYHRKAALCSNGIWFLTQLTIYGTVLDSLMEGDWLTVILALLVYVIATTEGSCVMMAYLLRTETGKRKVGSS